jgi:hypothetical protein
VRATSLFCGLFGPRECVRGCAREIFGGEDQREGTGSPSYAGIDDGRRGYLQTPARNSSVARPRFREGAKGREERGDWALYRHRLSSKRQGIKED